MVYHQSGCWRDHAMRILLTAFFVMLAAVTAEARNGALNAKKPPVQKAASGNTFTASGSRWCGSGKHKTSPGPAAANRAAAHAARGFDGISLLNQRDEHLLRDELKKYVGVRYKRGGTGRDGFDCSGFSRSMYQKLFGFDLPHNAHSQFRLPSLTELDAACLQTGDLVFFSSTARKKRICHVGIYLDDSQFIHAQSTRGVVVSRIDNSYWRKRLVSGRRLDSKRLKITGALSSADEQLKDVATLRNTGGHEATEDAEPSDLRAGFSASGSDDASEVRRDTVHNTAPRRQWIGLNYVRPVVGTYCNLQIGAVQEHIGTIDFEGSAMYLPLPGCESVRSWADDQYLQGLRLAGDIRPFQWMSITPSFIYYHDGHELDCCDVPQRSIGLDVSLAGLDAGWSLTTGLRYASLKKEAFPSVRAGDPTLLDLTFTYSRRLTRAMHLSLTGQHLRSSLAQSPDGDGSGANHRVFFSLHFHY